MHLIKRFLLLGLFPLLYHSCTKEKVVNDSGNLVPLTVTEDLSLPSIIVNNTKLHSEAFGHPDSSLVIVLHGGPGSDYRYLLNCKELANHGFRVVFYDQGGTGLSQRFAKSYYQDLQFVINELKGIITYYKRQNGQKVFLLGHSWGGILATAYVNQYPSEITGIVVGEPGGFTWKDILEYTTRARDFKITSEGLNDFAYVDQFLTGKKKDEHQIMDYKYALFSASELQKGSPLGDVPDQPSVASFWRYGAISSIALFELGEKLKPNWTTNLSQFSTKVLFIYSQNNKAYGLNWARHVSSAFRNVELFEVLNAGHSMFSTKVGWNNSFPKILFYLKSL
jgi:proline iminopeptidase